MGLGDGGLRIETVPSMFVWALLFWGLCLQGRAFGGGLVVEGFSWAPNYRLTHDAGDRHQLTDEALQRYPIWVHKGSVGWHNHTPVLIQARLEGDGTSNAGILRFRTAKGVYAGVWPPIRIDVFRGAGDKGFHLAGSYQGDRGALADKRVHWIDVPVSGQGADLRMVVHAQGTNIFLDEIEWRPQKTMVAQSSVDKEIIGDRSLVSFSTDLLKTAYLSRVTPVAGTQASWAGMKRKLYVWSADPWRRLPVFPERERMETKPGLVLTGFRGERETACLGLFRPSGDGDYQVEIAQQAEAVKIKKVETVIAANGELVFDPLVDLDGDVIRVKAGHAAYLWVEVDLSALSPGSHRFQLNLRDRDNDVSRLIPLDVTVVDIDVAAYKPAAVNWAYTSSLPIWNTPEKALADLVSHGVDVFVVPPQHIPLPDLGGEWDIARARKLRRDLTLFRPYARQILLALGWHPGKKPAWLGPHSDISQRRQREAVSAWARRLKAFMDNAGIPLDHWMLYPVDEPSGEKKVALKSYMAMLKDAVPDFRLYTNPVAAKNKLSISELKDFGQAIDRWGPSLTYAEGPEGRYFRGLKRPWWVYHNPRYPAKTGSPMLSYRLPAWRAWLVGASGIGVWSYDDTQKSSAWDDFDGPRGDWAMVYESPDGPVSSRRWEAFREGMEDLQLFRAMEKSHCIEEKQRAGIRRLAHGEAIASHEINALRNALLLGKCLPRPPH